MLTKKEEHFLQRASSRHRYAIVTGFALCFAGGLYGVWGVQQLDPEHAPRPHEAFDRPIARLALLIVGYQERLSQLEPQTEREETLLTHLKAQTDTTVRLILMLFRFLFASMVMTAGVVFLAVGLTQKQLLGIMEKLRKTPEPTSGTPVAALHGRRDG